MGQEITGAAGGPREIAGGLAGIYEDFTESVQSLGGKGRKRSGKFASSVMQWVGGSRAVSDREQLCNKFLADVQGQLERLTLALETADEAERTEACCDRTGHSLFGVCGKGTAGSDTGPHGAGLYQVAASARRKGCKKGAGPADRPVARSQRTAAAETDSSLSVLRRLLLCVKKEGRYSFEYRRMKKIIYKVWLAVDSTCGSTLPTLLS